MNNKYYTPTLEEFHVGFEYEYKELGIWNKEVIDILDIISGNSGMNEYVENGIDFVIEKLKSNEIRVKHLDREDIENWFNVDITLDHQKENLIIFETDYGSVLNEYCKISYNKNIHIASIENCNEDILFQGKIKNKSELKRILTQIGVL